MRKWKFSAWVHRLKVLPNTRRGLASGLCSIICLGIVLVIFLVSESLEIQFPKKWLILTAVGAKGLATAIFFIWARAAVKFAAQK